MRKLLLLILVLSFVGTALAADRVTLTITITNAPADGNTLTVNATARTWKTSPSASQILIGASIGANATNLYNHIVANTFTGPLIVLRSGTNAVQLVGQVGQANAASMVGTWGVLSYSTQTVQTATVVRVPLTIEPTMSARTNIASLLISNVFNLGLSTNLILPGSTAMTNFVNTSDAQTVAGVKTFSAANSHLNAIWKGGTITNNTRLGSANVGAAQTNEGIYFLHRTTSTPTYVIRADATGIPSLYLLVIDGTGTNYIALDAYYANVTPGEANILTRAIADYRFGQLTGANAWTGTNTFTRITNSTLVGSTFTNGTLYGTIGNLTNGTLQTPTLRSAINTLTAFQSYINDSRNVEIGSGAEVTNTFVNSLAIGQDAKSGADSTVAVGKGTAAKYATSTALGVGATTTVANQVRLGTSAEQLSAPGSGAIGGNFAIGHSDSPGFPASMAKGLYITNGTAATSDPANGAGVWVLGGELQYRTSGTTEGNGGTQRLHNRAQQVVGAGSNFTLTGAYALLDFGSADASVDLPTVGTYLVTALIQYQEGAAGGNDLVYFRFYDATAAAAIASSERYSSSHAASRYAVIPLSNVITVTGASTIQLQGYNSTAARGTAISTATSTSYIRLY